MTDETPTDALPLHWDEQLLAQLLTELQAIHAGALQLERDFQDQLQSMHAAYQRSARNLLHYLGLRRHDVRQLQEHLAGLGLSSLGRTESHVVFGLESVLKILHRLQQRTWQVPAGTTEPVDFAAGKTLLRTHTEELLGPRPAKRGVRIMVTMPSEAATDYQLVRQLLWHGMDCMRINCAHDDIDAWTGMVANLRRAEYELGKECRVLMDLAGPKLRTGPIDADTQVVKWSPQRDQYGRVKAAARVWLTAAETPEPPPTPAGGCLRVPADWLARTESGDKLRFSDLRGRSRVLELGSAVGSSRWATSTRTAYLGSGTQVALTHTAQAVRGAREIVEAQVDAPPASQQFVIVKPGKARTSVGRLTNKGPHLGTAVRVLDDILRRMEAHQSKKTARLRPLRLSAMTSR